MSTVIGRQLCTFPCCGNVAASGAEYCDYCDNYMCAGHMAWHDEYSSCREPQNSDSDNDEEEEEFVAEPPPIRPIYNPRTLQYDEDEDNSDDEFDFFEEKRRFMFQRPE